VRVTSEASRLNAITDRIIGAAIAVHTQLGPGLLESAYEACLHFELTRGGLAVARQKPLPLVYDNVALDCAYRMDLVVENAVVVEVKAVEKLTLIHEAQMLSYLKISGLSVGLILNFNVNRMMRGGIIRRVNGFPE